MIRSRPPSLTLLQTFETVARHGSFTRAADELCLTQSAVSRQVKVLEAELGFSVFKRMHRAIALTLNGQTLFDVVHHSLTEIETGLQSIRAVDRVPQVTVSASVAFAYFWLMPRLPDFRALHPDIDLRVLASDAQSTPKPDEVDVAIVFGSGHWHGIDAQLLFGECVYPVCSPSYLQKHAGLSQTRELLAHTLLHLDYGQTKWGRVDWPAWLASQGVHGPSYQTGIRFNSYPMVLQAAAAGQGVALGWSYITDPMVASGQLVRPVEPEMHTEDGYYLATFEGTTMRPEIAHFLAWLKTEAGGTRMSGRNAGHAAS